MAEVNVASTPAASRKWPRIRTGALAALVLLAGGVALAYVTTGRTDQIRAEGPLIAHEYGWAKPHVDAMAVLGGTLTFEDGCVLLDGHGVVWPNGTEWDSEHSEVVLSSGEHVAMGDSVGGGGSAASDVPPGFVEVNPSCSDVRGEWYFFNVRQDLEGDRR